MGIFGSFSKANQVIEDSEKDIARGRNNRPKDEVSAKRQQKNQGKSK